MEIELPLDLIVPRARQRAEEAQVVRLCLLPPWLKPVLAVDMQEYGCSDVLSGDARGFELVRAIAGMWMVRVENHEHKAFEGCLVAGSQLNGIGTLAN